jgi:hypothetical protein
MALNQQADATSPRSITASQSPRDVVMLPPMNLPPPPPPQVTLQPPPPYYSLFNQTEAPPCFHQNVPLGATSTTYMHSLDSTPRPTAPPLDLPPPHQGYLGTFHHQNPDAVSEEGNFLLFTSIKSTAIPDKDQSSTCYSQNIII